MGACCWQVMTPLIYKQQLWETSGHLDNYNEDMFMVTPGMSPPGHSCGSHAHEASLSPKDYMGLKPMNCPGHCLLVASQQLSYNDLPVRIADFSTLHRCVVGRIVAYAPVLSDDTSCGQK